MSTVSSLPQKKKKKKKRRTNLSEGKLKKKVTYKPHKYSWQKILLNSVPEHNLLGNE